MTRKEREELTSNNNGMVARARAGKRTREKIKDRTMSSSNHRGEKTLPRS
jgi:hypothetical protein